MHGAARGHFRAQARRRVRLDVTIEGPDGARARHARMVDASLSGAGLEVEGPLAPGDRIVLSIVTPTFWDPLRLGARIAWAAPEPDPAPPGRLRVGCVFEHGGPDDVRATWEVLTSLFED